MSTERNILGVLFGAAVGVGIGMLLAPEKGSETRRKIKEEAEKAKNQFDEDFNITKKDVSEKIEEKKSQLDEKVQSILKDASFKVDDVIDSLEKGLQNLKAKNKKFQES